MAFLAREYKVLSVFVVVVAVILAALNSMGETQSPLIALSFVVGASASALAGYIGMRIATLADVRPTWAARSGLQPAFAVAFGGGTVMGMAVTGLGLLGLGVRCIVYMLAGPSLFGDNDVMATAMHTRTGFSMGAS